MAVKRYNRICALLLALLLAGGTAGCAKEEQTVKTEKEEITLWYYWSQSYDKKELANLVNGFNRIQDEIEVSTQYVPDEDFKKRLALSMADGNMPDLIVSDIRMPEMRGDEFLMLLKQDELFRQIPVIMLSSEDSTSERIRLLESGADDYIVKPFNPMELKLRVKKLI